MTFFATLILLCLAVAVVASVAFAATRRRSEISFDHSAEGTGEVESELLRRPLRSRYGA